MKTCLTLYKTVAFSLLSIACSRMVLAQTAQAPAPTPGAAPQTSVKTYTVPAGTRIPLSLKSEISTATARAGDPVYCISEFPIVRSGAVVVPAGTYVRGVIDAVKRPGKVKGRAELQLHFTTLELQNGTEISLDAPIDKAPNKVGDEGRIKQNSDVGHDVQTVGTTSLAGAGVGGLVGLGAGNSGLGAGIGAGAGAVTGIVSTLFTRGKDLVFTQGTSMEMIFARPVTIQSTQLTGMTSVTGNPTN